MIIHFHRGIWTVTWDGYTRSASSFRSACNKVMDAMAGVEHLGLE